jgi:DNA-binding response OmpR family regulator
MAEAGGATAVLVVEDESIVALYVEAVLANFGFGEISFAHDLASGMALLASKPPGFAILDVNIGGQSVFPLAAALRERRIPFIFSTGRSKSEFPAEWSGQPIVTKPLSAKALAIALDELGVN